MALAKNPIATNQGFRNLVVRDGVHPEYLYYWLKQNTEELERHASGTTFREISGSSLGEVRLFLPPLSEQRWISDVLGSLDDKIEVNRRMNETLEGMARALFTSWFVDFDPVHAKAALKHHSPLEGESARQGRKPAAAPVGGLHRLYSPRTLQRAKTLRQNQTDAEGLLWHFLRNRQLGGYRFRRQQPVGPYIADFACLSEKLLIELDGGHHAERSSHDEARDRYLRDRGYRVLRVWNNDVFGNCFGVLERIHAALVPPPHQPSPDGSASATPPQGGSEGSKWSVERARAYLNRMDPEIANLFPDTFDDEGKPVGWKLGTLAEVADASRRGVNPADVSESTPYIGLEHMPRRSIALSNWEDAGKVKSNKTQFNRGDILFGKLRPYFHKVGIAPLDGICSTDIVVVVPRSQEWGAFALACLSSDEFVDYTDGTSTGTKMPRTSWKTMAQFKICLPSERVVCAFQSVVRPLLDRLGANISENRTLAQTRDLLLPKLISGEIRAPKSAQ